METFEIKEQTAEFGSGEALCVTVSGYLDASTIQQFEQRVDRILSDTPQNVVISFEGLEYISSSGIGVVLGARQTMEDYGGKLQVINMPDRIRRIFDVLGFSRVIPIMESLEEAFASFQAGEA